MTEAVTSDPAQGPALALLALVLGALKTTHGFRQAGGRLCCFFLGGKNVCVCVWGGGELCRVVFCAFIHVSAGSRQCSRVMERSAPGEKGRGLTLPSRFSVAEHPRHLFWDERWRGDPPLTNPPESMAGR